MKQSKNNLSDELGARNECILRAIVKEYIQSAEPVSSRTISEKYSIGLKAASIRSVMSELEKEGYIMRPHSSAGRIPTLKSYRVFVSNKLELTNPGAGELRHIENLFSGVSEPEKLLLSTTKALSDLTHLTAVVLTPTPEELKIRTIRFVEVDHSKVMLLIVSMEHLIYSNVIEPEEMPVARELEKMNNYLEKISFNTTLGELTEQVKTEMKKDKFTYEALLNKALKLSQAILSKAEKNTESRLHLEGTTNIFDQPEFKSDMDKMKSIFSAFEKKNILMGLLTKSMEEGGIHICMDKDDLDAALLGLSFVVSPYGKDGQTLGSLGVIGPARMDYSKVVPLVSYVAGSFGKAI
ncbi:MAG: heat-inducible transcription repressor HrcA [Deltaproteobacteria bacterium]|nr:heat-inducible transcription repressor HrcA [Deltaproteobacteria bacterium]